MLGLPDLLVLDEPTNGLDPPQIAEMREVLRRYAADGPDRDRVQPPAGRGGADLHPRGRHAPGPRPRGRPGRRDRRRRRGPGRGHLPGAAGRHRCCAGWTASRPRIRTRTVSSCSPTGSPRRRWSRPWSGRGRGGPGGPGPPAGGRLPGPGRRPRRVTSERRHDAPAAPGYRAHRTLPLRVEFVRQLRRWRTIVAFAVLVALPWILVAAFEFSGPARRATARRGWSTWPPPAASTSPCSACSCRPASCWSWWSRCSAATPWPARRAGRRLRYLLAVPVPRARLLRQKLAVALAYARRGGHLPVMALLAGTPRSAGIRSGCRAPGCSCPPARRVPRLLHRPGVRAHHRARGGRAGVPAVGAHRLPARRGRRRRGPDDPVHHPGPGHRARLLAGHPAVPLAVRLAGRRPAADLLGRHARGRLGVRMLRDRAPRAGLPAVPATRTSCPD